MTTISNTKILWPRIAKTQPGLKVHAVSNPTPNWSLKAGLPTPHKFTELERKVQTGIPVLEVHNPAGTTFMMKQRLPTVLMNGLDTSIYDVDKGRLYNLSLTQHGSGHLLEALYFSKTLGEGEVLLFKREGRELIPLGVGPNAQSIDSQLLHGTKFDLSSIRVVREAIECKSGSRASMIDQIRRDIQALQIDFAERMRREEVNSGVQTLITKLVNQLKEKDLLVAELQRKLNNIQAPTLGIDNSEESSKPSQQQAPQAPDTEGTRRSMCISDDSEKGDAVLPDPEQALREELEKSNQEAARLKSIMRRKRRKASKKAKTLKQRSQCASDQMVEQTKEFQARIKEIQHEKLRALAKKDAQISYQRDRIDYLENELIKALASSLDQTVPLIYDPSNGQYVRFQRKRN